VRTYDMGGKDSTLDVAKAIADYTLPEDGRAARLYRQKGATWLDYYR
jgi:hypothetical protein